MSEQIPEPEGSYLDSLEPEGSYRPKVPVAVRDVVYYAGVLAGAAGFIFVDEQIVARAALAVGFIASSLGVAYRPGKQSIG